MNNMMKRLLTVAALSTVMLALPLCAVKFDCGCGTGEEFVCHKLLENFLLMGLSCWLLAGAGRKESLRYALKEDASQFL